MYRPVGAYVWVVCRRMMFCGRVNDILPYEEKMYKKQKGCDCLIRFSEVIVKRL